jgi:S1-C subfamily serine protease
LHSDYHKPTDDYNKVNPAGEYRILQYIFKVIESTNQSGKLVFTPTREQQTGTSTRFVVTLGILPDYTFSGNGVRVDGVSEGRPAQKAGLQAGDIVIQLGNYPVSSLENYMQALNKFKKGDKTKVKVKRASETVEADILF